MTQPFKKTVLSNFNPVLTKYLCKFGYKDRPVACGNGIRKECFRFQLLTMRLGFNTLGTLIF